MAIVKTPLISLNAHGQIAKSIQFQYLAGRHIVKVYNFPTKPPSLYQQSIRRIYRIIFTDWKIADQSVKDYFNTNNPNPHISGFNYFVKWYFNCILDNVFDVAIFDLSYFDP